MVTVVATDEQDDEPVDTNRWGTLAARVLDDEGLPEHAELSVVFVDERAMTDLNGRYAGHQEATDVLAFPMDELDTARPDDPDPGPALLGDVVLCPAVAESQAVRSGHDVREELRILTIHGILHVLGMDHAVPDDEREMFALTERLLGSFRNLLTEGGRADGVEQGDEGTR